MLPSKLLEKCFFKGYSDFGKDIHEDDRKDDESEMKGRLDDSSYMESLSVAFEPVSENQGI